MAARQQVLDKTDLFGTLPPELLGQLRDRTALAATAPRRRHLREGRPRHQPLRRVLGPGRDRGESRRRPRVGDLRARAGRAVRRDVDVRRRGALRARPRAHDGASHRGRLRRRARGARAPARRALGGRAHPRPPPARHRRGPRRRDVPRRDRAHRQAPARPRRRRRLLPHAAHPRGAGRAWSARRANGSTRRSRCS